MRVCPLPGSDENAEDALATQQVIRAQANRNVILFRGLPRRRSDFTCFNFKVIEPRRVSEIAEAEATIFNGT